MDATFRPTSLHQLAGAVTIGLLVSCGGSGTAPAPVPHPAPTVTSVSVSGASSMVPGQTSQFSASANLSNGAQQTCTSTATWQTTNTSIVTVSSSGMVTAVGSGTVQVRATCNGITGNAQVSVESAPPDVSGCAYGLTSAKTVLFESSGGSGNVTFQRTSGSCTWTANSSDPSWLTVVDASGTGHITVRYNVGPNSTAQNRQGLIHVRWPGPQVGENITINQSAGPVASTVELSGRYTLEIQVVVSCGWPIRSHRWPAIIASDGCINGLCHGRVDIDSSEGGFGWFLEYSANPPASTLILYMGSGFITSDAGYVIATNGQATGGAPASGAGGRPQLLDASLKGEIAWYSPTGTFACGNVQWTQEVARLSLKPR